ncbi:hypothetical protein DVH05_009167 [Phytophthora capsici]|nr:hypothetical protein DVH05_009167 [Phytophthora capsici]
MGGAGADGELVLQVATEDVAKAPETTSKTVSALLSFEWEMLVQMVNPCVDVWLVTTLAVMDKGVIVGFPPSLAEL